MPSKKTKIIGGSVLGALVLGAVLTPTVIAPTTAAWGSYQSLIGDDALKQESDSLATHKAVGERFMPEYEKMQEFFMGWVPFDNYLKSKTGNEIDAALDEADRVPVGGWVNKKVLGGEKLRAENLPALKAMQEEADPYLQATLTVPTMEKLCNTASGKDPDEDVLNTLFWQDMENFYSIDYRTMVSYCDDAKPELVEKYGAIIDEARESYAVDLDHHRQNIVERMRIWAEASNQ